MAPVHWAAGSDGETNFGVTSLAAPNAASLRVARYSFTARLAVWNRGPFAILMPGIERCCWRPPRSGLRRRQTLRHRPVRPQCRPQRPARTRDGRCRCRGTAHGGHARMLKHPDHELRIDRGPAHLGIIGRELPMHPRQIKDRSNLANEVIVRNNLIKMK